MLTSDQMTAAVRAALGDPDTPLAGFGLEDTAGIRTEVERLRSEITEMGVPIDIPSEWPTAGSVAHFYAGGVSAGDAIATKMLAADKAADEKKVDATMLEAERFLADVDDSPLPESKREYVRDGNGRFATVHGTGAGKFVARLGTDRHGSTHLDASDHALIKHHLATMSARMTYGDAYDRGRAARDTAHAPDSLTRRHEQMKASMVALRALGTARSPEAEVHAETVLDSAGYIDGALGIKRRYRRNLFGDFARGVQAGAIGQVGAIVGKDEYDALTAEEKREYVRDADGQFARVPGSGDVDPFDPAGETGFERYDDGVLSWWVKTMDNGGSPIWGPSTTPSDIETRVRAEYAKRRSGRLHAIGTQTRNAGATMDPKTGLAPTDGYIVAIQGHNKEIPEDEFFADRVKVIADYLKEQRRALAGGPANQPRMLGLWHDKDNHEVVLDVVEQHHDRETAAQAGRDRNQQAIWDVANEVEIETGGTGDRAAEAKAGRPDPASRPDADVGRGDRGVRESGGGGFGADSAFLLSEEKREYVRDSEGQFARVPTHSGMRVGDTVNDALAQSKLHPDPTRMSNLPEPLQAAMVEEARKMGATPESLEVEIQATLNRAIARTGTPPRGHDWYEEAHDTLVRSAERAGISSDAMTGATAAASPQMAWAPNLAVARYIAENRDAPIDVDVLRRVTERRGKGGKKSSKTNYEWALMEIETGRKIDGKARYVPSLAVLDGSTFADLDPYVASALMKSHAQQGRGTFNGKPLDGNPLSIADDITGDVRRVNFTNNTSGGRALRIIRGEDPNLILNGHKVRSFYNNLSDPTAEEGDVTVDSHAVSLALGRKVSSSSEEYTAFASKPVNGTIGLKGSYPLWADAYRRVAERNGLRAQQLQSITWIQWRHEHPDNARTTHRMD